jgi:excisionase family DNA binding protein
MEKPIEVPVTGFSVREVADRLGVADETLRAWLKAGKLPYYRLGHRIVITEADLLAWLATHRIEKK